MITSIENSSFLLPFLIRSFVSINQLRLSASTSASSSICANVSTVFGRGAILAGVDSAGRESFPVSSFRLGYYRHSRGRIIECLECRFAPSHGSSYMTADGRTSNKMFANLSQVLI